MKLLIENIATALHRDPQDLSDLELRNLCILIDWSLTLATFKKGISCTPLLTNIEISSEEVEHITAVIVEAINNNTFSLLDQQKPDSTIMDTLFEQLGELLGFSRSLIQEVETGFISDYELKIKQKGLIYTNFLIYKNNLSLVEIEALQTTQKNIQKKHKWLDTLPLIYFDQQNNIIKIESGLTINSSIDPNTHFYYLLDLLFSITHFSNMFNRDVSQDDLLNICEQLQSLTRLITPDVLIDQTLQSLIKKLKNKPTIDILKKLLSELVLESSQIRNWKTLTQFTADEPIHRFILMGYEDVNDEEIIRTVNMMYRNHPKENIVVSYSVDDTYRVNNPFTLQVIGHGTITSDDTFNANLGPFRGDAVKTGQELAKLVNACPMITHVRLSCCFSGKLANEASLAGLYEKPRNHHDTDKEVRRKFLLTAQNELHANNTPFASNTAALSCWTAINKKNREISMTVSPGIIEPDEEIGRMVWKAAPSDTQAEIGVKEICITTSQGPKCLPFWRLKRDASTLNANNTESVSITNRIFNLSI